MSTTTRMLASAAAVIAVVIAVCSCGSAKPAAAKQSGFELRYAEAPAMLPLCSLINLMNEPRRFDLDC